MKIGLILPLQDEKREFIIQKGFQDGAIRLATLSAVATGHRS